MSTLSVYYVLDCSGSMAINQSIKKLNQSIQQSLTALQTLEKQVRQEVADFNLQPHVVRVSTEAHWHLKNRPLSELNWKALQAEGYSALGEGLQMVWEDMQQKQQLLKPVLCLVSDGLPTDYTHYQTMARRLQNQTGACLGFSLGEEVEARTLALLTDQIFPLKNNEVLSQRVVQAVKQVLRNRPVQQAPKPQTTEAETPAVISLPPVNSADTPAQEIEGLKNFFNDRPYALIYQDYEIFRVGFSDTTDSETHLKGGPALFKKVRTNNTFFVVALKQQETYCAFPNTKKRFNILEVNKQGLNTWFDVENPPVQNGRYYIKTLEAAVVQPKGERWELIKKGRCQMQEN